MGHSHSHDDHSHDHSHDDGGEEWNGAEWDSDPAVAIIARTVTDSILKAPWYRAGLRVLDFGGGTGATTSPLLTRGDAAHVTVADMSDSMLQQWRSKISATPGWEDRAAAQLLTQPDGSEVADAQVDITLAAFVMHHVPKQYQEITFTNLCSSVKPGGRLVVAEFPCDFNRADLTKLYEKNGFEDVRVEASKYLSLTRLCGFIPSPWQGGRVLIMSARRPVAGAATAP